MLDGVVSEPFTSLQMLCVYIGVANEMTNDMGGFLQRNLSVILEERVDLYRDYGLFSEDWLI